MIVVNVTGKHVNQLMHNIVKGNRLVTNFNRLMTNFSLILVSQTFGRNDISKDTICISRDCVSLFFNAPQPKLVRVTNVYVRVLIVIF